MRGPLRDCSHVSSARTSFGSAGLSVPSVLSFRDSDGALILRASSAGA